MPKRQHIADNGEDDEDQLPTPSSKRARTVGSSDSEDQHPYDPSQTQARARRERAQAEGKGKGRAPDTESDDEEEDEEIGDQSKDVEMNEEQFENIYGEKLRVRLEKKRKTQGGVTAVADHGIIEYIEMHQFMCHKFLTFTFGPQINFIIGM
ncbi:hypothetical protein BYT27DRAFT_6398710 [Phlegmacium glaucopus]|nr:hypothetical protein BYT27DRAFT_6398710 [Phlegmacium glaucopus]